MFLFFYNIGLQLYLLAVKTASSFNKKAKKWIKGRENIFSQLEQSFKENKDKVCWFHAASLGEFEQARPVIESFKEEFKDYKILLTFFSPSGYEIRKNYPGADFIFYLPLDTKSNAEKFINITKPELAYFVKYEFWFHYLAELNKRQIPAISFSAIFRPSQIFFKDYGKEYLKLLSSFKKIFVQDEESKDLLSRNGIENSVVTGDTRFDRVLQIAGLKKNIPIIADFKDGKKLIVIGSAWDADIQVFLPVLLKFSELRIIIAPHEMHEPTFSKIEKLSENAIRFSKAESATIREKQVLIIDNIGMLSSLYAYAEFACIGGSFGKGLHNILEAAVYGIPLFFGNKNYKKFKEARDLKKAGAAFAVKDEKEFNTLFERLYQKEDERKLLGESASDFVKNNAGATRHIINFTKTIIENERPDY